MKNLNAAVINVARKEFPHNMPTAAIFT
ncbi:MAG: hypothetical protein JWO67_4314, partial [Streptosporangiaceae bacterium]|nr:hypothetical protein [Streptosporangiaceae bacterium]